MRSSKAAHAPPTDPTQSATRVRLPGKRPPAARASATAGNAARDSICRSTSGGVKFDPYVLGELAHWGEALDFTDRIGPTARWACGPACRCGASIRTIAKPTAQRERHRAQGDVRRPTSRTRKSTATCPNLPLYDLIDDNNIEAYRRWFPFYDFGGPPPVPPQFDERDLCAAPGLGSYVAALDRNRRRHVRRAARPAAALADQARAGGQPAHRRLDRARHRRDLFPNPNRDNFGQVVGLAGLQLPLVRGRPHHDRLATATSTSSSSAPKYTRSAYSSTGRRAARCTWASIRSKGQSRATCWPRPTTTA